MNLEQRQDDVRFEELPRQQFHGLGVAQLRADLRIGDPVGFRQGRRDLVLRAMAHLDEQLAEKLAMALLLLFGQGPVDLLLTDHAPRQQKLAELHLVLKQNLTHTPPLHIVSGTLRQSSGPLRPVPRDDRIRSEDR